MQEDYDKIIKYKNGDNSITHDEYLKSVKFISKSIKKKKYSQFSIYLFDVFDNPYEKLLKIPEELYKNNIRTLLYFSIYYGNNDIFKFLASKYENLNMSLDFSTSIDDIEIIKLLSIYFPDYIPKFINEIIYKVCCRGCTDVLNYFFDNFSIDFEKLSDCFNKYLTSYTYQDNYVINSELIILKPPVFSIDIIKILFEKANNIFPESKILFLVVIYQLLYFLDFMATEEKSIF